jgi:hypothetical protein
MHPSFRGLPEWPIMTNTSYELAPREHRHRVLKGATIIVDLSKSEISCTIRNQHSNGAELRVPLGANIPAEFTLYVPTLEWPTMPG